MFISCQFFIMFIMFISCHINILTLLVIVNFLMGLLKLSLLAAFSSIAVVVYLHYPNWIPKFDFSRLFPFYASSFAVGSTATFGLKMSLILASFYAAQGLFPPPPPPTPQRHIQRKKQSFTQPLINRIPFHFMEIPLLLGLIVFGSALMPEKMVSQYTRILAGFAPFTAVLESFAFMTVALNCGKSWTPRITNSHNMIKLLVIFACFASFAASSALIYTIYAHFRLSTLIASLISSIWTLVIVQIIACCQLDHATITDPALMFPYIAYNLLIIVLKGSITAISAHQRDPKIYPQNPQNFLKLTEPFLSLPAASNFSLLKQILLTIFSPVLVSHLFLQMALLTIAKLDTTEEEGDEESYAIYHRIRQLFVAHLWPRFGKSFLVLIYTISWLEQCHPEIILSESWYLNSFTPWRWISILICLAWYSKHLLFDSLSFSSLTKTQTTEYTCEKTFWNQFHNLKDE